MPMLGHQHADREPPRPEPPLVVRRLPLLVGGDQQHAGVDLHQHEHAEGDGDGPVLWRRCRARMPATRNAATAVAAMPGAVLL